MRLSSVERLGGFAEPAGEAVVDECELQGAFESVEDGLLAGLGILVWRSAYRADFGVGNCHIWQYRDRGGGGGFGWGFGEVGLTI